MRNKFTLLLLTAFLTIIVSAAGAQTNSGLEVSNPRLIYDINRKVNFRTENSTSSNLNPLTTEIVQEISALFRNTGTKSIKQISWQYIGYKDASRTEIKFVYTSKNTTVIAPGDAARLNKIGRFWGRSSYMEARVFRVEYADGTIWEVAKIKK
jgi:hypothetical protein